MIKQLFFMTALLASGLAHAQVSAPLDPLPPVTPAGQQPPPPPGNIVCDQGPNTTIPIGALGADLAAAGFTHCALNADFTTSSTDSNGINWSNPNTWLNECGATMPFRFYLMFTAGQGDMNSDFSHAPCNRAAITTFGGSSALHIQYAPADTGSGKHSMTLWWPGCGNSCGQGPWMSFQGYWEVTYVLSAGSQNQQMSTIMHAIEIPVVDGSGPAGAGWVDVPFLEAMPNVDNPIAYNALDWYNASFVKTAQGFGWNIDESNSGYHTIGDLLMTDGTTTVVKCTYYDGVGFHPTITYGNVPNPHNCMQLFPNQSSQQYQNRSYRFGHNIGSFAGADVLNPVDIYIKSIRVFTCAGYKTGTCWGPVVVHTF